MARVRTFAPGVSVGGIHPTETDVCWGIVHSDTGCFLQVSSFGSDARESRPKVSQTLQFDRTSALQLKRAIEVAFPDL